MKTYLRAALAATLLTMLMVCMFIHEVDGNRKKRNPKVTHAGLPNARVVRNEIIELYNAGKYKDMLVYLDNIERELGDLVIDNELPALYTYRGVALASTTILDQEGAIEAFRTGTEYFPEEPRLWMNMGEVCLQTFAFDCAIRAFLQAELLGAKEVISRIVKVLGWTNGWNHFEESTKRLEVETHNCFKPYAEYEPTGECVMDSSTGVEHTSVSGKVQKFLHVNSPNARPSLYTLRSSEIAGLWDTDDDTIRTSSTHTSTPSRKLKVGFLSSDFGVHPVSSLIRGAMQFIDKTKIEVFCFSINPKGSWWSINITKTINADHFIGLDGLNTQVLN